MSLERKESGDEEGYLNELHDKMRDIVTGFNDSVKGRCAVCLENFCEDQDASFTDRTDLVRINNCYHRFHLICVHRDWFMQRKDEKDSFGCVLQYSIPEVKRCPICRREVEADEIKYIHDSFKQHPEVEDGGYAN